MDPALVRHVDAMIADRDVDGLAWGLFGRRFYPGQASIARLTAFLDHTQAAVCCYTQYGKTFGLGTGLAVDLVADPVPRKYALIGPTSEQAKRIRSEFMGAALSCPLSRAELGLTKKGAERLKAKRVSEFVTKHDKEYRILTTGKNANAGDSLMGHGVDSTPPPLDADEYPSIDDAKLTDVGVIVVTEAGLVPESAWPKIERMRGDKGILIVEGNPWAQGTGFHRIWEAAETVRVHIDIEQGVREGRMSRERADVLARDTPPLLHDVLWKSIFPSASIDALIDMRWVLHAESVDAPRVRGADGAMERYSLDVAEGGDDFNVLTKGWARENVELPNERQIGLDEVEVEWQKAWAEPDTMVTADRAAELMPPGATIVVDAIGVGKGPADRLAQRGFKVIHWKSSHEARDADRFKNAGSEGWWRLRLLLERNRMRLPLVPALRAQLVVPKWTTKPGKIVVDKAPDGAKSPDHAESLMMLVARGGATEARIVKPPQRWQPGRRMEKRRR